MLLVEVVVVVVAGSDGTGSSAAAGDGGCTGTDDRNNGDGLSAAECFIFFRTGESLNVLLMLLLPVVLGDTRGGGVTNSISPKTKSTICDARSAAAGSIGL